MSDRSDIMSDMQPKEHRITLRVSNELRRRIKREAKRTGSPESEVIRSALEKQLREDDEGPSAYDILFAKGVIGCVKGARPDLSTNKKYFEGFGES